ncbi:MAG: putative membrane protein YfcA [Phenylobacterium sp.]|jgi:uncharacterized membrane protein YfcA
MTLLTVFLICLVVGALVGFLAGLLGIGGGLIIVPVLSAVLVELGIVGEQPAFLIAIATSLASIIFTSFVSALSHHRHRNVDWSLAGWVTIGVGVGAGLISFFSEQFSVALLKTIFALTVSFVALRMVLSATESASKSVVEKNKTPNKFILLPVSSIIGGLSTLIGIGGGALIVPMLSQMQVDVKKSIGISSVAGTCVAFVATTGYIGAGWGKYALSEWFLGYVYLPALAGIIITSSIFAPFGAKAVQRLPINVLRRIFAAFLLIVVLRMLLA